MLQDISNHDILFYMQKRKPKSMPQKNKNNKTKPENLMKKEYLESYEELKKAITKNQSNQNPSIDNYAKENYF